MVAISIYIATLPGALEGIKYYLSDKKSDIVDYRGLNYNEYVDWGYKKINNDKIKSHFVRYIVLCQDELLLILSGAIFI